jgi:hypothetical protein
VTLLGSENVGIATSTRWLSGASGRSPGTNGWGIVAGWTVDGSAPDGVADPSVPLALVQAPATDAAAMATTIRRPTGRRSCARRFHVASLVLLHSIESGCPNVDERILRAG